MYFKKIIFASLLSCLFSMMAIAQKANPSFQINWQFSTVSNSKDISLKEDLFFQSNWEKTISKSESEKIDKNDDYEFRSKLNEDLVIYTKVLEPIELELEVNSTLKINEVNLSVFNGEIKLLPKNDNKWRGVWTPYKHGLNKIGVEGVSITGEYFTSEISIRVDDEILITYFSPIDSGVYEPKKKLYFQVEAYDDSFSKDVLSVHFEIDTIVKEAVYDSQLNRWVAEITLPSVSGMYEVRTIAKDNSGNASEKKIEIEIRENIPNEPPQIKFIQPKDGETILTDYWGNLPVRFKVQDLDGRIDAVSLIINGQNEIEVSSSDSTYLWDWRPEFVGIHSLEIIAEDNDGAIAKESIYVFIIGSEDLCAPKWSQFTVYFWGDVVSFKGVNYWAKGRSYQEKPDIYSGPWDTWEYLGECTKSSTVTGYKEAEHEHNSRIEDLSIFPIPATDVINFAGLNGELNPSVQIVDLVGNVLITKILRKGDKSISITELSSGSYIAVIKFGSHIEQRSFIKK